MVRITFQLNNVEEGGRTVFPTSFAAAAPKKGSAIFWYNSFSDGTPDFSTAHSDCPVVLGEKWGKKYWFNTHSHVKLAPCFHVVSVTLTLYLRSCLQMVLRSSQDPKVFTGA